MRNSIYSITLDEALTAVGGHHRYQAQVLAVGCALCFAAGLSASSLLFLTQKPIFDFGVDCSRDPCEVVVHAIGKKSPHAPAVEWRLVGSDFALIEMLPALYLLGAALSALVLSALEHCFGRRKLLAMCAFAGLAAALLSAGAWSYWVLPIAMPLKGAADCTAVVAVMLSLLEVTDGDYRSWYAAGLVAAANIGFVACSVAGTVAGEWRVAALLPAIAYGLCVPLVSTVSESPRYLAAIRGKYLQARSTLHQISQVNGKTPFNDMLEGEKVIGYQKPEKENEAGEGHLSNSSTRDATGKLVFVPITKGIVSVSQGETHHVKRFYHWHLICLSSIRGVFIVSLMTWVSVAMCLRSLWRVPGDGNALVQCGMWAGDLALVAATAYLLNHLGRLGINITYLATGGLAAVLTIAFVSPNCHPEGLCVLERAIEVILLHTARVFIKAEVFALALYTLESFPTAIRFLAAGTLCAGFAGMWLVTPLIASSLGAGNLNILMICGVLTLVCSIISCLLNDVDLEELHDYVEEEKEEMSKPAELSQVEIHPSSAEDTSRRLKSTANVPFQVIAEEQS